MVKMILTVPHGFNAEHFCHVVSAVVNDGKEYYDRPDYDLGDMVFSRKSQTPYLDEYHISADLIDFETVDVICKLQELCPLVGIYFENDGTSEIKPNVYDKEYYNDAYYELFKAAGVTHGKLSA